MTKRDEWPLHTAYFLDCLIEGKQNDPEESRDVWDQKSIAESVLDTTPSTLHRWGSSGKIRSEAFRLANKIVMAQQKPNDWDGASISAFEESFHFLKSVENGSANPDAPIPEMALESLLRRGAIAPEARPVARNIRRIIKNPAPNSNKVSAEPANSNPKTTGAEKAISRNQSGEEIEKPDPLILNDPPKSNNVSHYANRLIKELPGREKQWDKLKTFLEPADQRFVWCQIAGIAGQGKSRMAIELVFEARKRGWRAGFLMGKHLENYLIHSNDWVPASPTLIVIDYVVGNLSGVRQLHNKLTFFDSFFENDVRLLLVERQRWDRAGGNETRGENSNLSERAGWYMALTERSDGNDPDIVASRYLDGVVELLGLNDDQLIQLVSGVFSELSDDDTKVLPSSERVLSTLKKMDGHGRPLYAYLLAQAYVAGVVRPEWTSSDLLRWIIDTDQSRRWAAVYDESLPERGNDDDPAMRLALLATICSEIDCRKLGQKPELKRISSKTRLQALCLTANESGVAERGGDQIIRKLEPDLLGEWFVLDAISSGANVERLLSEAWELSSANTAAFLERTIVDFPDHPSTAMVVDLAPRSNDAQAAYKLSSAILVDAYLRTRTLPTDFLFGILEEAAAEKHLPAMDRLAYCLCNGRGTFQDKARAFQLWQEAATEGYFMAVANVAVCFQYGIGCKKDIKEALKYYEAAAKQNNGWAMANIGLCYKYGDGYPVNPRLAIDWLNRSVEHSDGWGAANLGKCYEDGFGVKQDIPKAITLYRDAVSLGDGRGMAFLGECHETGKGVNQSLTMAIELYREGVKAFDGDAMTKLGLLYFWGRGVTLSKWNAVALFSRGAKVGSGIAFFELGRCFEHGIVVRKDKEKALEYYRKSAGYYYEEAESSIARLMVE